MIVEESAKIYNKNVDIKKFSGHDAYPSLGTLMNTGRMIPSGTNSRSAQVST
jgi:hypothetical protein